MGTGWGQIWPLRSFEAVRGHFRFWSIVKLIFGLKWPQMTSEVRSDLIRSPYCDIKEHFLYYDIPPKYASFYDLAKKWPQKLPFFLHSKHKGGHNFHSMVTIFGMMKDQWYILKLFEVKFSPKSFLGGQNVPNVKFSRFSILLLNKLLHKLCP